MSFHIHLAFVGDPARAIATHMRRVLRRLMPPQPNPPFVDKRSIRPGQRWKRAVIESAMKADVGLLLITPEAVSRKRDWLVAEAALLLMGQMRAKRNGDDDNERLFVLLFDSVTERDIPDIVNDFQACQFKDDATVSDGMERLLEEIVRMHPNITEPDTSKVVDDYFDKHHEKMWRVIQDAIADGKRESHHETAAQGPEEASRSVQLSLDQLQSALAELRQGQVESKNTTDALRRDEKAHNDDIKRLLVAEEQNLETIKVTLEVTKQEVVKLETLVKAGKVEIESLESSLVESRKEVVQMDGLVRLERGQIESLGAEVHALHTTLEVAIERQTRTDGEMTYTVTEISELGLSLFDWFKRLCRDMLASPTAPAIWVPELLAFARDLDRLLQLFQPKAHGLLDGAIQDLVAIIAVLEQEALDRLVKLLAKLSR